MFSSGWTGSPYHAREVCRLRCSIVPTLLSNGSFHSLNQVTSLTIKLKKNKTPNVPYGMKSDQPFITMAKSVPFSKHVFLALVIND
jgi:hypothetical protein